MCKECGVCCSGALFSHVRVSTTEEKSVRKAGLCLHERKGMVYFDLPCSCFSDDTCTVYDSRPARCRDYYCTLENSVLNGSIPVKEARTIVADMKQHADWLSNKVVLSKNSESQNLNLRDFLFFYQKKLEDIKNERKLSAAERTYIKRAFEYVKLIDRYFLETSLLTKWARLVQTMDDPPRMPNKTHVRIKLKKS